MLGLLVGFGVMFGWGFVVILFSKNVLGSKNFGAFQIVACFGPLYFLWYNGNTNWEQYGEFELVEAVISLYAWPYEMASGIENILGLETGTLGGWP